MKKKATVILGAGFTGLSAGYLLSKKGYKVTIIELNPSPGGIGSEIINDGNRYEMGAHLFHCPDKEILNEIKSVVGEHLIPIERTIKINFNGKYYDFPLKMHEVLFNLPVFTVIKSLTSYLYQRFKNLLLKKENKNTEDVLINNYGKVLYNIFFKSYIANVWGIKPSKFSPKFANQRIPNFNILEIISKLKKYIFSNMLNMKAIDVDNYVEKVEGQLYTTKKGFAGIAKVIADKIILNGGSIIYNSKVERIILGKENKIQSIEYFKKRKLYKISLDSLITTIPINNTIKMIYPKIIKPSVVQSLEKLKYRSLVFVGFIVKSKNNLPADLTYYRNLSFNRLTDLTSIGIEGKINDTRTIIAEITCNTKDAVWENDILAKTLVFDDLESENIFDKKQILDSHVFRLEHAYPIYIEDFDLALEKIKNHISEIPNITTAGRQGNFQYINSHIAIRQGYNAAEHIINYYNN